MTRLVHLIDPIHSMRAQRRSPGTNRLILEAGGAARVTAPPTATAGIKATVPAGKLPDPIGAHVVDVERMARGFPGNIMREHLTTGGTAFRKAYLG